jgi:hypothetical protein
VGGAEERVNIQDIVDHLVYATPDLHMGIDRISQLLGVEATPGGQHPGRGTRNALVALGPRTYLEIVGPDLEQPGPRGPRWFRIDELSEPKLVTWATPVADIDGLASRAAAAGISLGAVGEGHRARTDGRVLRWRFTDPAVLACDGVVPFLIDWASSPHPAATAIAGGLLTALRAEHPNDSAAIKGLRSLGLDLKIDCGERAQLIATIRMPRGEVELR